ncbi:MAG: rhodanese-like domain-containing protein [Deltaproteobacteria bacterium]|nr:rhodanese-like domain-containing protein [Deltaproteobacteria bacterium]
MTTRQALSPSEAHAQLGDFQVVDVRGAHEYHGPLGRVRGATLLPLPELEARADELPRGRALLLVCRSGVRSGKACDALAARGFEPVVNLTGGMIAWNEAGLPIEQTEPVSLAALVDGLVAWAAQVGARPQTEVRDELRTGLAAATLALDAPSRAGVARALELVEASFRAKGAPPDLELSLASYRRWLAGL